MNSETTKTEINCNRILEIPRSISCSRNWIAFALLFFIVGLVYSNTFHASWHLDDLSNIIQNKRLHLSDLKTASIIKTFYAHPKGGEKYKELYRPVACLTLALNWYLGQENVTGYHIVNISIHILCAFFLFLTIMGFYDTPLFRSESLDSAYFVALLSAVLWAVNPIQTQAVTYIVQRMASLATLFYIIGIYLYVKGRNVGRFKYSFWWYTGCIVSFFLAIGSKENAITLPLAIILLEAIFYHDLTLHQTRKRVFRALIACSLLIGMAGILFFIAGDLSIFKGYGGRSFGLWERLMTEPRVILFYMSQILYPAADRFSIDHDIVLSTSLFHPWTTLPAIALLILLTGIGISQLQKRGVISFAIFFFFLNHLIESTVIPLELIFEHRNYLPSLFFFLPVSIGFKWLLEYYTDRNRVMYLTLTSFAVLLIVIIGLGTYARNFVWASEETLWSDAVKNAPNSARALQTWISNKYDKTGSNYEKALTGYEQSLLLNDSTPNRARKVALNNIGRIYFKKGEYEKSVKYCLKILKRNPNSDITRYYMALALVELKKWDIALENVDKIIVKNKKNKNYLNLKGSILIEKGDYVQAIRYFQKSLNVNLFKNYKALFNLGVASYLLGDLARAERFFTLSQKISPGNIEPAVCMINVGLKLGNRLIVNKYLEILLNSVTTEQLISELKKLNDNTLWARMLNEKLKETIIKKLLER